MNCNYGEFRNFCEVLTPDLRIFPNLAGVEKSTLFLHTIRVIFLQIHILETMSILSVPKYPNRTCKVSNCLPYLKFYFDADFKFVLRGWHRGMFCCSCQHCATIRNL